jgi:hypothetical protein
MRGTIFTTSVVMALVLPMLFANAGELDEAITSGNRAKVEELLAKGASVDDPLDLYGSPLLLVAA